MTETARTSGEGGVRQAGAVVRRRSGQALPVGAPVVRGGLMKLDQLRHNAEATRRTWRRPGISVMAADVGSHAEVIRLAGERLPFETVRLSFAGPLQRPPFGLEQTNEPPPTPS